MRNLAAQPVLAGRMLHSGFQGTPATANPAAAPVAKLRQQLAPRLMLAGRRLRSASPCHAGDSHSPSRPDGVAGKRRVVHAGKRAAARAQSCGCAPDLAVQPGEHLRAMCALMRWFRSHCAECHACGSLLACACRRVTPMTLQCSQASTCAPYMRSSQVVGRPHACQHKGAACPMHTLMKLMCL